MAQTMQKLCRQFVIHQCAPSYCLASLCLCQSPHAAVYAAIYDWRICQMLCKGVTPATSSWDTLPLWRPSLRAAAKALHTSACPVPVRAHAATSAATTPPRCCSSKLCRTYTSASLPASHGIRADEMYGSTTCRGDDKAGGTCTCRHRTSKTALP